MRIELPDPSLVLLMGASGSGKSTFAQAHFRATEVLSSDRMRGLVADDENDQAATGDAFDVLHSIAGKRLAAGRITVVDATNVKRADRAGLVKLAKAHDLFCVVIALDLPEALCHQRNEGREDRDFGPHVVRRQCGNLRRSLKSIRREGIHRSWVLRSPEEVEAASVRRAPLWSDRRTEHGPFDVIGDVHGCRTELDELLAELGYVVDGDAVTPPEGRRAVFVGDYVDRGPDSPGVLRLVMGMVAAGTAICVPGNHDSKLARKLNGRSVQITHGLGETLSQLSEQPPEFKTEVLAFIEGMVSHVVLHEGELVVAHAGMKEAYQGRSSGRVRNFALYGETTGETDEFGLPVRGRWAEDYRGRAAVVFGHTPVPEPLWVNGTVNIDTGCVFGGALTALRWPERETVSVPAHRTYYEPARPFLPDGDAAPGPEAERPAFLLDVEDVAGKRIVETRLGRSVTVGEEQSAAALEVMSRFAVDPRWLVYLPPTMAPTATSQRPDLLEHPEQVFAEFRTEGVPEVICEEKHMGSRAIVVVCRDAAVALDRFGVDDGSTGAIYTRTGRPFLDSVDDTEAALARVRDAASAAGIWESLDTGWLVLDCELMPWSAKAQSLIEQQYAAVGSAGRAALAASGSVLAAAALRGLDVGALQASVAARAEHVDRYIEAYGRYVGPVAGVADLRLAPFHVLAGEGHAYVDRPHTWHLEVIDALVAQAPDWLVATGRRVVDVTDETSVSDGIAWWTELTAAGGEGMVVKPMGFVARGRRGYAQPGVKCRGREYLRIIYGPEYGDPSQIDRLRGRGLGRKRGLAWREFALGVEGLERFARREPLYRVHECAFAVLALESEPVDPRL